MPNLFPPTLLPKLYQSGSLIIQAPPFRDKAAIARLRASNTSTYFQHGAHVPYASSELNK